MAGRVGFEPTGSRYDTHRFSRPAQSTALPSSRIWRQRQDSNLHVPRDHRLSKPAGDQLPNSGVWRKGRDSNPRNRYLFTHGLANRCLPKLGLPSKNKNRRPKEDHFHWPANRTENRFFEMHRKVVRRYPLDQT